MKPTKPRNQWKWDRKQKYKKARTAKHQERKQCKRFLTAYAGMI